MEFKNWLKIKEMGINPGTQAAGMQDFTAATTTLKNDLTKAIADQQKYLTDAMTKFQQQIEKQKAQAAQDQAKKAQELAKNQIQNQTQNKNQPNTPSANPNLNMPTPLSQANKLFNTPTQAYYTQQPVK